MGNQRGTYVPVHQCSGTNNLPFGPASLVPLRSPTLATLPLMSQCGFDVSDNYQQARVIRIFCDFACDDLQNTR